MKRSPGSRSTISVSTCTDSWMPTARVITLRYCEVGRLLFGDGAGLELRGDQRVVLGEPVALAVAHQVDAAVADVADDALVAARSTRHTKVVPMPRLVVSVDGHPVDVGAGALHGDLDQRRGGGAVGLAWGRFARSLRCCWLASDVLLDDLGRARRWRPRRRRGRPCRRRRCTGRARVDQHRVFVVLALPADVGQAKRFGGQRHAGHLRG